MCNLESEIKKIRSNFIHSNSTDLNAARRNVFKTGFKTCTDLHTTCTLPDSAPKVPSKLYLAMYVSQCVVFPQHPHEGKVTGGKPKSRTKRKAEWKFFEGNRNDGVVGSIFWIYGLLIKVNLPSRHQHRQCLLMPVERH